MNPLRWKIEHQVAGILVCVLGAAAGLLFAWLESSARYLAVRSISGEFSDYTGVFLAWLKVGHYWPWPLMGAVIAGLAFYVRELLQ